MVLATGSTSTPLAKEGVPQLTEKEIKTAYVSIQSLYYHINSHVHPRVAGSGFHLPSALQTALILSAGTNPELHLKNITAPSVVFSYGSKEPFPGAVGPLQLTAERKGV